MSVRTSKIILGLWLALGAFLLLRGGVGTYDGMLWTAGLAAAAWNRIDSRTKGYKLSVGSPGGASVRLDVK
jgi:hypothetical protein